MALFIVLMAFILRVAGINYGLPDVFHQDEPYMVNTAVAIGISGWNTGYFVIPPFVPYCLFIIYGVIYAVGYVAGVFPNTEAFALLFFTDPTLFYLAGRLFMAVLGTLTVFTLMRLGTKHFSELVGLTSGLLLCMAPIHVAHSHYIYADIPLTLAVTLLLDRLLTLMKKPTLNRYALMGVVFGWAIACKYTAVYFLLAIVFAHVAAWRWKLLTRQAIKSAMTSAILAFVVFAAIAPYTFLDWPNFIAQILHQSSAEGRQPILHHFLYSLVDGTHPILVALALWGLIQLRGQKAAVLLTFIVSYYITSIFFSQTHARYMLPIIPAICLAAGVGLDRICQYEKSG